MSNAQAERAAQARSADAALQGAGGVADQLTADLLTEVALDTSQPADVRKHAAAGIVELGEQNPGMEVRVPDQGNSLWDEVQAARVPAGGSEAAQTGEEPVAAAAEPEVTGEFEFPSFAAQPPDDLDLDDIEDDPEPAAIADEPEEQYEEEWIDQDEQLRRELAKAKKEAAHYKQLRARESEKKWRDEASRRYPLAAPFLDDVQADSRRSYLKQAQHLHARLEPFIQNEVLAPVKAKIQQAADQVKAAKRGQEREQWGPPLAGPARTATTTSAAERASERSENAKDFHGWVKAQFEEMSL